jgi:hypothetical protein
MLLSNCPRFTPVLLHSTLSPIGPPINLQAPSYVSHPRHHLPSLLLVFRLSLLEPCLLVPLVLSCPNARWASQTDGSLSGTPSLAVLISSDITLSLLAILLMAVPSSRRMAGMPGESALTMK